MKNILLVNSLAFLVAFSYANEAGEAVTLESQIDAGVSSQNIPLDQSVQPDGSKTKKTMTPSKQTTHAPVKGPTKAPTAAPVHSTDYSCVHANSWLVNTDGQYSNLYASNVDVTTSGFVNSSMSTTGWQTTFTGIPFYGHVFTQDEINKLNSRPRASTDFTTGQTTAVAGTYYDFGDDIGYASTKCTEGYWPTGPDCPVAYSGTYTFPSPASPETQTGSCLSCGRRFLYYALFAQVDATFQCIWVTM